MNRCDFVFRLYNNGNGLTLDQIQTIEDNLPLTFPESVEGFLAEIADDMGLDPDNIEVMENAMSQARDVFMDSLHDCADLLELRDYLKNMMDLPDITDSQVYNLWYAVA